MISEVSCRGLLRLERPYIEQYPVRKRSRWIPEKYRCRLDLTRTYYYEVLSELTGTEISGEYELMSVMKELVGHAGRIFAGSKMHLPM